MLAGTSVAEQYRIDRNHSSVTFSIRHIVSRVQGGFTDFAGQIVYDPANPEQASVQTTIQTASVNTDNQRRDDHLKAADFFEVEKYPEIIFKSTKVEKVGENMLKVTGDLALHGVTKSVEMAVEIIAVGTHPRRGTPMAGFEGMLKISRVDYGIDSWAQAAVILGEEVNITLNIEAVAGG